MSQYTDKFTIVISAPQGALAEHLAALLEYTVNHDTSVNLHAQNPFARTSQTFFHDLEYLYTQQETQTSFAEFVNNWSGETPAEPETRVIVSSLPVQDVAEVFPNSKIVKIATTEEDANQLGFNYFIRESNLARQAGRVQHLLEVYKMKATRFFGLINVVPDWDAILTDSMILDQFPVQCVIRHFARDHRLALTTNTDPCPDSALIVNFSELCDVTLRNHADANARAVAKIYEFLGVLATKQLEEVQNIWVDFMNSFTPYRDIG